MRVFGEETSIICIPQCSVGILHGISVFDYCMGFSFPLSNYVNTLDKKVEKLRCFFEFFILLMLGSHITDRTMDSLARQEMFKCPACILSAQVTVQNAPLFPGHSGKHFLPLPQQVPLSWM